MIETAFNMKNKKIFIDGLRSFLIIGGFLSPSYSVFAMKRSTKMKKQESPKTLTKGQQSTKNMPPKKKNKNSKPDFFTQCKFFEPGNKKTEIFFPLLSDMRGR